MPRRRKLAFRTPREIRLGVKKVHVTPHYRRLRLRDPASLRRRGFRRFRILTLSEAKGLTRAQLAYLKKRHGKLVAAFKGRKGTKATEGRPQAMLIPRRR